PPAQHPARLLAPSRRARRGAADRDARCVLPARPGRATVGHGLPAAGRPRRRAGRDGRRAGPRAYRQLVLLAGPGAALLVERCLRAPARRHALMQTARALVTIGHGPCPTARVLRSLPAAGARSPGRPARQGSAGPIVAAHVSGGRADEEEETPTVRALVTGGAGFIGSHLCDRLLA